MPLGIKGFTPTSLIDWPGKIAAVIFLPGCNFRCHYCCNPEFLENIENIEDVEDNIVFNFLEKKKKWLDGVVMLGGEPTIHKNFWKIIGRLKDLDFKIAVHTNGTNPECVKELLDKDLVSFFAMDIKAPLESYKKVVDVEFSSEAIKESVQIIRDSKVDYEFRTTVVPGFTEKEDIKKIGEWLCGSKKYFIQQFRPEKLLDLKLREVKPFKIPELLEFKKIAEQYFDKVEVRGI